MTDLHCNVTNCGNNKQYYCCRPDIMVGGPRASAATQTYCANFIDAAHSSGMPQNAIDHESPNPSLDVHCEVTKCTYNQQRACNADHIDIRTTEVNNGQIKTECATFEDRSGGESSSSGRGGGGSSGWGGKGSSDRGGSVGGPSARNVSDIWGGNRNGDDGRNGGGNSYT